MSETAARAPSIGVGIIYCLLFENRTDVSLTMENANDREHVLAQQIVNAEFVKSLHGPRAKIAKYRIAYRLGGTSLRPRQREFDAQFDRTAETFRDIREPLLRIPFKLPHNVSIRRWQKDELHGFTLRAAYFSAILSVLAFRLFEYSTSIGMGSPDASPSSNSASNRASASRSCASRNRLRKYSLMSPYPLLATWASTNCLRDSGNEMVTVVMAGPYFVSAPNWRSFYLITIEKKLNRPRAAQHAARKAFDPLGLC